ncbi:MAG TPA: DUF6090 family protein [Flavobacteriaceae bacterium]
MIKFFRKIRQKLLSENKFGKYLTYAIGEIFLVVIGILIALQINDWNDVKKNKVIEQQLLTSLLEEFQANLILLDSTIKANERIYETSIKIGEFTGPLLSSIPEKSLSLLMIGAFKYEARFVPNLGTMNEIDNSGKLSLISDPNLRKSISEWKSQLELVHNQESYVVVLRDNSLGFFIKYGNFRRHLDIIDDALLDATPSRFPNNDFGFLKNQEFESNLYLFIVASIHLNKAFYLPLKEQTELLIKQINQNIN